MEAVLSGQSPNYETLVKDIILGYPKEKICSIVRSTMESNLVQLL
jgi:hypothetical protein